MFAKTVYFVGKDVIIFFRWPQYSQNGFAVWRLATRPSRFEVNGEIYHEYNRGQTLFLLHFELYDITHIISNLIPIWHHNFMLNYYIHLALLRLK